MRIPPRPARPLVLACAVLALPALTGTLALASSTSHDVAQRDHKFSVASLEIQAGDTVAFGNDDKIRHNVMTSAGPERFNLGVYGPGERREHRFVKAGRYEVRCGIHPRMKLAVTVR
jgi:plastocyanin